MVIEVDVFVGECFPNFSHEALGLHGELWHPKSGPGEGGDGLCASALASSMTHHVRIVENADRQSAGAAGHDISKSARSAFREQRRLEAIAFPRIVPIIPFEIESTLKGNLCQRLRSLASESSADREHYPDQRDCPRYPR